MIKGMSNKVTDEQLDMVRSWAADGVDLNGIQKKLVAECGVHLTYMEVRFLLLDHGIEIRRPEPEVAAATPAPQASAPAAPGQAPVVPTMTLDDLQIPGTLLSGKCEFPSGTKVAWQIDQMGQLSCSPLSGTMTPEEQQAFVFELRQILSKM